VHAVAGTKDVRLSVGLAYDAIAADYDAQVSGDDWMRQVLHAHYARAFCAGQRVLDIGCGTGIYAVFLAGLGVQVLGLDGSVEMIALAREKVGAGGFAGQVDVRVLRIEEIGRLREDLQQRGARGPFGEDLRQYGARGPFGEDLRQCGARDPFGEESRHAEGESFDGLISAFASLSSLPDLASFADDAAGLVKPGGRLILHLLNRFSLWEWLGYLARRDLKAARKVGRLRSRRFVIGGQAVLHSLYFANEAYHRFFKRDFVCRDAYSLGALRPPHTLHRMPRPVVESLEWLDTRLGRLPLLRDAGRFFVLDLERRPAQPHRAEHD
jgi:SAM-dependent methyltransferase